MRRIFLFLLLLIMLFSLGGCSFGSVKVVFDNKELSEKVEDDNSYALNKIVEEHAKIEIKGKYKKDSEYVTCKITAPDMYSFLTENYIQYSKLDADKIYKKAVDYIKQKKCPTRTTTVKVPVTYDGEKLIADTSYSKYQNAVNGGMNDALTEFYLKALEEMQ